MHDPRGSVWRKWDLHVHTPMSLCQAYGGEDAWDEYIEALRKLPPEIKVLGINDYIFIDGYRRVRTAKLEGKLPNIDLLLPVIELRVNRFGGSKNSISRVNYHIIFSDKVDPDVIESQFLSALSSKYVLTHEFDEIRTSGRWAATPTRQSLEDLGRLIIESVPQTEQSKYGVPIIEGFNNLCLDLQSIKSVLSSHYFDGNYLTAVGKTEWADIKWNDQSIAEKKTLINDASIVFVASENVDAWKRARVSLTEGGVNNLLLDCSDAHQFADSQNKDRLGNCLTWIKSDPTFEGLRQAVFEYDARVRITESQPLDPPLKLKHVTLTFPEGTQVHGEGRKDPFCFSGGRTIEFSPNLTCIVGGRGTGKSTLLNLLHEKLVPKSVEFFLKNQLSPAEASVANCVEVAGITEPGVVEFLQQNEIEQFASDSERLTTAIFTRLRKLDKDGLLRGAEERLRSAGKKIDVQIGDVKKRFEIQVRLADLEKELATQKGFVDAIHSDVYTEITLELSILTKERQSLKHGKERVQEFSRSLQKTLAEYRLTISDNDEVQNAYERAIREIIADVDLLVTKALSQPALIAAAERESELTNSIAVLRARLDEYLGSRGLSPENLSDVGQATERIAELTEEIASMALQLDSLEDPSDSGSERAAIADYEDAIGGLLGPISGTLAGLSSEVRPIELKYEYDRSAFRSTMMQIVSDALGKIEGRVPRMDYLESKLADLDFTNLSDLDTAISAIPLDNSVYARSIREYLSHGVNFEILKLQAEVQLRNVDKFGHVRVLYDGRPLEASSFGQRCTAVIVVLLWMGNTPIVIDEPEAHLDSSLIAKYLVKLIKNRKEHRQIIFATHNANFVVNGDAELIHCLAMDENNTTTVMSMTIEDLEHRELLLALEGGQKAFQQRERRYGID